MTARWPPEGVSSHVFILTAARLRRQNAATTGERELLEYLAGMCEAEARRQEAERGARAQADRSVKP